MRRASVPECSICTDAVVDPRVLPCGHSFCGPPKSCLKAMSVSNGIKCCLCNSFHRLKVNDLKPLFGIREFLQEHNSGKSKNVSETADLNYPRCENHHEQIGKFWCSCNKVICLQCLQPRSVHQNHDFCLYETHVKKQLRLKLLEIEAAQEGKRTELMEKLRAVEQRISELQQEKTSLMSNLRNLDEVDRKLMEISQVCDGRKAFEYSSVKSFLNSSLDELVKMTSSETSSVKRFFFKWWKDSWMKLLRSILK